MDKVGSIGESRSAQVLHFLGIFIFYLSLYILFFSPILFSGRLLAPGDGMFCYLPNFTKGIMLWDPMLFSGYPIASDPQAMIWYPLSFIFSWLGSWNGFVLSSYVSGSSFTYGYVYTLTQSRLAGLVSGLIYGMSGFMMAHLGHTTIIHGAAWIPLLLWAVEKQRHHFTPFWFGIACISFTLNVLSGHPQISVYALGLSMLYAGYFGWSLGTNRWKYYGQYVATVIIGLAMASILLIPASEFISQTTRSQMTYHQFVSYSLPPHQIIKFLFPFLFGGLQESFYGLPYFGQWNLAEVTGYVGILPLLLAGIGTITFLKKHETWFWIGIAVFSFLLALGDFTPLPKIMYHVPILNKFQAIGRHLLLVTFAVSILSGLGIMAIQREMASRKLISRLLWVSSLMMGLGLAVIFLYTNPLKILAAEKGIEKIEFLPWANLAIGIPVVIFIFATITLLCWDRKRRSCFWQSILLSVLVIDLASFSWFIDWKYWSPMKSALQSPPSAQRYSVLLQNKHQRMIPIRGVMGAMDEIPPNLSKLYHVPSASGYASLFLSRLTELLSMGVSDGGTRGNWSSFQNKSFDLMAIRYIFLPKKDTILTSVKASDGMAWHKEDLLLSLGTGCDLVNPSSVKINLPKPIKVNLIGVISSMSCSTSIPDGTEVLRILATDINERVHSVSMLAGRDTSEWAFDFPEILPLMKHKKAKVFSSFPVIRGKERGAGHRYLATLFFGDIPEIKCLEFQWVGPQGILSIQKISLLDKNQGISYPLTKEMGDLTEKERWRHLEDIGEVSVYENLRAMPRVWLVQEVKNFKKEEVLRAIHTSQLPDGSYFDPYKIALVEEPFSFKTREWDERAKAHLVHLSNTRIEIQTHSKSPSFLVLSDVYYPGWKASINGVETHLFQTNYFLRGIMVPAGSHVIHFEFKPRSFYYGAGLSAGSFILLILLIIGFQSKRWRTKQKDGALP